MTTPSPADGLRECPFCGAAPQMWGDAGQTFIRCGNDQCIVYTSMPMPYNGHGHVDSAIAAWNRRTDATALRLREGWRPISTGPKGSDEVVLLCDANGNRWTDCWPGLPVNGCGYPAVAYMPLPAPPTADDLARVLEEGE